MNVIENGETRLVEIRLTTGRTAGCIILDSIAEQLGIDKERLRVTVGGSPIVLNRVYNPGTFVRQVVNVQVIQ